MQDAIRPGTRMGVAWLLTSCILILFHELLSELAWTRFPGVEYSIAFDVRNCSFTLANASTHGLSAMFLHRRSTDYPREQLPASPRLLLFEILGCC